MCQYAKLWSPFFRQYDGYTIHFYVFWDADSESDIENFEFEKRPHDPFEICKTTMSTRKPKFENFNKKGSYRLQMTRGFQIWPQNLNRTIVDPLLAKKRSKTRFCQFSTFLAKNVFLFSTICVQCTRIKVYSLLTDFTRRKRHSNVSCKWHLKIRERYFQTW